MMALSGFGGHLIAEQFIEQQLASRRLSPLPDVARRLAAMQHRSAATLGPGSSPRALLEVGAAPMVAALGFVGPADIAPADHALVATLRAGAGRVALVVAGFGERLDALWRTAVVAAQDRGASWTLLFNGTHLRLIEPARVYSRRFVEFDLDVTLEDEPRSSALCSLITAPMFDIEGGITPIHVLVEESDRHGAEVCRSLRTGVLVASEHLVGTLADGRVSATQPGLDEALEQALTIVYRLLFLLFAESRLMVPLWNRVYRESYSISALRQSAESRQHAGLWDALRAIARLAHAGCRAGDLRVTPFNGRLFSPARTPLAERARLNEEAAASAVLALATRPAPDRGGREPIAYRDLGVEQLGAVYETLLDYRPLVVTNGHRAQRIELTRGSGLRKATGTFYTPEPFVEYLVARVLGPLVHGASAEAILRLRVLDPSMGSGAFLVAACRYLANAYESALIAGGGYAASDFDEVERAAIRRTIVERCLYGVDLNPMAVQLARLSLWLATLASDRPLTFLDHRLRVGDSLVGAWLRQLRRRPEPVRPRRAPAEPALFDAAAADEAIRLALPVRFELESIPGDTIERIRDKERAVAALERRTSALARWKQVADVWCASWLARREQPVPAVAFHDLAERLLNGGGGLPVGVAEAYLSAAAVAGAATRPFHWELEFPEVFFDADGARRPHPGFDAVLGNPPWDMLRADAGSPQHRGEDRERLDALIRFFRASGTYEAAAPHPNRYQLFLERSMSLTRAGGRLGLVLPSGLASDYGSGSLRRLLLSTCGVDAIVGFDNRRGVFPIHRSVKFLLLTATAGERTRSIACRFGEHDAAVVGALAQSTASTAEGSVHLTPALLERLSGPDLAIPELRSARDLAIVEQLSSAFPALGATTGWSARFGRELNATDDRGYFGPPGAGLPIVEGKQIQPFRVDLVSSRASIPPRVAARRLAAARFGRARLGYRDVASATNRTTLIAAMLPAGCVSTHTVFCLRTRLDAGAQWYLCGVFNSFVVNYLVRQRVTTHVTTATVERIPVPYRQPMSSPMRHISALARLLARRDDAGAWAELQAHVAALYELDVHDFEHVLDTFPLVAVEERQAALRAFKNLRT